MAKNRNKKKSKTGPSPMDTSTQKTQEDLPQAMDTSETTAPKVLGVIDRKIKKGVSVRRSKNIRKIKAINKAISREEKSETKMSKQEKKKLRTQSAKTLYE